MRLVLDEPKSKRKTPPRLTDAERYSRFVETARKVEASEDPQDFENAFKKIVPRSKARTGQKT